MHMSLDAVWQLPWAGMRTTAPSSPTMISAKRKSVHLSICMLYKQFVSLLWTLHMMIMMILFTKLMRSACTF